MPGHLGIAILRVGITDVREFLPVHGFHTSLADGGVFVFIGRILNELHVNHAEVFLMGHIQQSSVKHKVLVVDLFDEIVIQPGPPSFQVTDALLVSFRDGIHDGHDMLALEGGIAFDPPGEIPAVAEIFRFVVEAYLVTDLSLLGLDVKPRGILEMEDFQVL